MSNFLKKKPWLWIVLAFILLIAAWAVLITIAVNNQPESIEVEPKGEPEAAAEATQ